jgi:acetyl-CoA carboxylase carboxyltransferase component
MRAPARSTDVVESEAEAFARTRRFLSYLPSSVHELPPRTAPAADVARRDPWLIEAVPRDRRKVYDMRRILRAVVDADSLFEMGRKFGGSVITALARLDGWPVAVMASDPYFYGGGWTADASQKAARFVDLANTFHLPVVHLVDVPGFVIGQEAEKAGTIRQGARALAAIYQAKVPWCSVIIRKVFGVAGAGHTPHHALHYRYAWPSGDWGSLPVEGGIEAAYRAELDAAPDRDKLRAEIEERLNRYRSPFRTAETFLVEEIIDPRDTRPLLCEFANLTAKLREPVRSRPDAAVGNQLVAMPFAERFISLAIAFRRNILRIGLFGRRQCIHPNARLVTCPPLGSRAQQRVLPCKSATASSKPSATRPSSSCSASRSRPAAPFSARPSS